MKDKTSIDFKIQHMYTDLDLLDEGHFYEHDTVPGNPSYHTLAKRMRENLDAIVKEIEKDIE